jgi:hypothetical protein
MGKFNNKISAEFTPPKKWKLERALSYKNDEIDIDALEKIGLKCPAHRVTAKKGFVTDLASVHRVCWNVLAPWDIARAAIIHDLLYKAIRQYRAKNEDKYLNRGAAAEVTNTYNAAKNAADKVFLMGMKDADPSVPAWKIQAAYRAVQLFGRWSIIPRKDNS